MQQEKDEQRHGKIVAVRLPMSLALDVESAGDRELLSVSRSLRTARHQQLIGKEENGLSKSRSRERPST